MKRYNIINNALGWLCFLVAAATYLLTIEPTASFWDCPEFISQGYKLEVGHPPGNPIFMLAARFFVTLFGGTAQNAAIAVNSMSALLSAGTILLLFWTITHLVKRLMVADNAETVSMPQLLVIMGAGLCGALAYTWSDTFWFSAVEGEVYAFSSFCTALVFWLILKWENRADKPHSDRYLILIAYIIGISIAVHLLNLLCIPAIGLVFYYKKFKNTNVKGSLIALVISAAIVGLILYGLVPGFITVAQRFELLCVNGFGLSYNIGVFIYALVFVATSLWAIYTLRTQRSAIMIKCSFGALIILSGMPFIGHGWVIPVLFIAALLIYLFAYCKVVPVRIFNVVAFSVFVIFIGYSSYALLLIRANANTPMNQNSPDNVFALASYLNREQYGDRPLFNGPTFAEEIPWKAAYDNDGKLVKYAQVDENGLPMLQPFTGIMREDGKAVDLGHEIYTKIVKSDPSQPDRYVKEKHAPDYQYSSDMNMLFTRSYSSKPLHVGSYKSWAEYTNPDFDEIPAKLRNEWRDRGYVTERELSPYLTHMTTIDTGDKQTDVYKGTFDTNLRYFINYQLNHMYWRYFMWNFAGRQNDYSGNGEPHMGNWISGIPVIDNARLGDQSLLPDQFGKENPAHNVFYMLPLLMGIFGLLWQSLCRHRFAPNRGIEQFWIVFFLFFMTGIAIVLYLNQTPGQPRERDYAFAGSFYAFAIWLGMGVPAIFVALRNLLAGKCKEDLPASINALPEAKRKEEIQKARIQAQEQAIASLPKGKLYGAIAVALLFAIGVPLQMVSQTWDDHDRSGRYTTRDFGCNYLNSLDPNAIIFVNGDNDTFPLWYAQEVEGVRTDVKVVNLSYLSTDWYANQIASTSYEAKGVPMFARPTDFAYDKLQYVNQKATDVYRMLAADALPDPDDPNWKPQFLPLLGLQPGQQTYNDMMAKAAAVPQTVTIQKAMHDFYSHNMPANDVLTKLYSSPFNFTYDKVIIPLDSTEIKSRFGLMPPVNANGIAYMDASADKIGGANGNFSGGLSEWLTYDIVTRSATDNFKRPVYFAITVGESDYYPGFANNTFHTGMAAQVTPFARAGSMAVASPVALKGYINIVDKFAWGGLDKGNKVYLDETVRNMVSSTRRAIITTAGELMTHGDEKAPEQAQAVSRKHGLPVPHTYFDMAANLLNLVQQKLPESAAVYENGMDISLAESYITLGLQSASPKYINQGLALADKALKHYGPLVKYAVSIGDKSSKIGQIDRRNVRYNLPQLIGLINMAEVGLKIIEKPSDNDLLSGMSPQQQLDILARIVRSDAIIQSAYLLFIKGIDNKQIQELMDDEFVGEILYTIKLVNEVYGVNGTTAVKRALKQAGISASELQKSWTI